MIVIYHQNSTVVDAFLNKEAVAVSGKVITVLLELAGAYPEEMLVWCDHRFRNALNLEQLPELLHHKKMLLSYNPAPDNFISDGLGYIDHASILRVNKKVRFFSWQASSAVGATSAEVINAVAQNGVNPNDSFDYFLNSFAKRAMPEGLFCYSEPKLFKSNILIEKQDASEYELFKFVRQHHDLKWLFILLLNFLLYEKKVVFLPFVQALFYKRRRWKRNSLDSIAVDSRKLVSQTDTIDVIIPTIGREKYVYDVLRDLKNQTHLPLNVIIVEQNPTAGSVSGLNFITEESWPFAIDHIFTHQSGACNARNLALSKVKSEWVFLNDDDNRFAPDLIEKVLANAKKYGVEVLSTAYPQPHENTDYYSAVHQTTIFGSGNSFIKKAHLAFAQFGATYEFGYGEDFDFGMQLRNAGIDVVYFPDPAIMHLKAPMGGFRIKPVFEWSDEKVLPIPSPTVMLNNLKYRTPQQLQGYKTIYFFKTLKKDLGFGLLKKYNALQKHWKASILWANRLKLQ